MKTPRHHQSPHSARRHGPRRPRRLRLARHLHRLRIPPRLRDRRGRVEPPEEAHLYRWPDATRNEVLARLLELNAARGAEEIRADAKTKGSVGKRISFACGQQGAIEFSQNQEVS